MYRRHISAECKNLARKYRVVTVTGPRQSGKTTLVRHIFPDYPYVNLEDPDARELANDDPRDFLEQFTDGVILDEIQRVPKLLSYIQVIVDETQEKGKFILTGSHQLQLHEAITQSLAGRTALLHLLPMSLTELRDAGIEPSLNQALLNGGYPGIYSDHLDPTTTYRNYFATYIERDLRQLINVKDLNQFQRFIRLCAGRTGQVLNASSLGADAGISTHTVKNWLSILQASFILFFLSPYYENFGKRIIKAPKLYFSDVGLASYLLGIEDITQMNRDPLRGNLFENLVVLELMKSRLNRGRDPNLYYFRDTRGHEVDLIFKKGHELIPIEIKASKTYNRDFLKNLRYFESITRDRCPNGYLIYAGSQEQKVQSMRLLNYTHAEEALN